MKLKLKSIHLYFAFLLCTVGQLSAQSSAQSTFTYHVDEKSYYTFTDGTSLADLSKIELLQSKIKLKGYDVNEYFDNGNYVRETEIKYHENIYPSWYVEPSLIEYSNEGTKQYFAKKSSFFEGGWFGHQNIDSSNMKVQYDEVTWRGVENVGLVTTAFSSEELDTYNELKLNFSDLGFKTKFHPTYRWLEEIEDSSFEQATDTGEQFNFRSGPDFRQLYSDKTFITWYITEGREEILKFDQGDLVSAITKQYSWDPIEGQYMLLREQHKSFISLDNSDCAVKVKEKRYKYNRRDINPRAVNKDIARSKIKCIPNPVSDFAKIQLDNEYVNAHLQLYIFTSSGFTVLDSAESSFTGESVTLNLANLSAGYYHLLLHINDETHSLKINKI